MKLLLCILLSLIPAIHGQTANLNALRSRCLPNASESTLRAIVQVESGGHPNAMQIDFPKTLLKRWGLVPGSLRLSRQPRNRTEALEWLSYLRGFNIFVDLGLMQISTAEAQRRGIPPEELLEPCTNLRIGWQILQNAYSAEVKSYGPGQTALQHAISRYNTGDTQRGIDNGYLARVIDAARSLQNLKTAKKKEVLP